MQNQLEQEEEGGNVENFSQFEKIKQQVENGTNLEEQERQLEQLISKDETQAEYFEVKAKIFMKTGRYIQALGLMEKAMYKNPELPCCKSSYEHYQIKKGLMRMNQNVIYFQELVQNLFDKYKIEYKIQRPSHVCLGAIIGLLILTIIKFTCNLTLVIYLLYQSYHTMKLIQTSKGNSNLFLMQWFIAAVLVLLNEPITIITDTLPFDPYLKLSFYILIFYKDGILVQKIFEGQFRNSHEKIPVEQTPTQPISQLGAYTIKSSNKYTKDALDVYKNYIK
ncbi:hypothetical protein pb186bvf_009554 [Paramecium bursaria]